MTDQFVFDVMEKFNSSDIVDLDLTHSDVHITLRKKEACFTGSEKTHVSAENNACDEKRVEKSAVESVEKVQAPKEACVPAEPKKEAAADAQVLKAPIVGTFYRSPSPDSPAYAEKGTKIKKGNPVCIIEAMKMMNTLNADFDFEVLDVLVENGQLIEFDQPLFSIKKL